MSSSAGRRVRTVIGLPLNPKRMGVRHAAVLFAGTWKGTTTMSEWTQHLPKARDRVTLKQLGQAYIRALLEETGIKKEAAAILDMHPVSLSRKVEKEKIVWTKYPRRREQTGSSSGPYKLDPGCPSDAAEGSTDD